MYTPDDTRKMVFSLREVMNYHTTKIPEYKSSLTDQLEPGELIRFVTNPMESVIRKNTTTGNYEINTLGHTLSRWREIRYLGTRLEVVPLATTGKVDPEDITQSASGIPRASASSDNPPAFAPQGSIHPYDAINFVSYRRWTGGNISVAAWDGTNITSDNNYVQRCLAYDQNWLADERFNHVKLTDGFKFDAVPLRVDLETAALAGTSLFGFSTGGSIFPDFASQQLTIRSGNQEQPKQPIGGNDTQTAGAWLDPVLDAYFQPRGLIMPSAGNQYHEEGWLPNPLAGFHYTQSGTYTPGNDKYVISGFYDNFPWFADRVSLETKTSSYTYGSSSTTVQSRLQSFDLNYLVKLVLERFINPLALIRFPCAYGTMFFWNIFMEHIMEVRKPFLVNSTWNAAKVQVISSLKTPLSNFTSETEYEEFRTPYKELGTISCISPDPYGLSEEPSTVTLSDLTPMLGYHTQQEPRTFRNPSPDTEQEPEEPDTAASIPHN